jgi:hypothetical protein
MVGARRRGYGEDGIYLRDPGRFRRMLRPACRRCTARRGITGPIACRLPPYQTVCHRHRLWTGPAARTHAGQLDISPFPEILRAQRRHLAQLRLHPWQDVEDTISAATRAIYQALRDGIWIPGQRQRLQQLAPGTWDQALAGVLSGRPGRSDDGPATQSSRSPYTPASSGSPHAASGRTAPATAPRPDAPAGSIRGTEIASTTRRGHDACDRDRW